MCKGISILVYWYKYTSRDPNIIIFFDHQQRLRIEGSKDTFKISEKVLNID